MSDDDKTQIPPDSEPEKLSPRQFAARALDTASTGSEPKSPPEEPIMTDYGTPFEPVEEPKKSNTALIIAIVVIVLLCCCCAAVGGAGWYLWNNGDEIFGLTLFAAPLLI